MIAISIFFFYYICVPATLVSRRGPEVSEGWVSLLVVAAGGHKEGGTQKNLLVTLVWSLANCRSHQLFTRKTQFYVQILNNG